MLAVGGTYNFESGVLGFHAEVADHHVIDARFHAGECFSLTGRGFYLKTMEFQNRFQGQEDGKIVIHQEYSSLHVAPLNEFEMQARKMETEWVQKTWAPPSTQLV